MLTSLFNALQSQTIKSLFSLIAKTAVGAFVFVLLVEVVLRLVPSLISERLLAGFHPETRTNIAQRRGLPTEADTFLIQRDDNGPELRIPKPFTKRNWKGGEPGTVDSTQMDEMGFCNPSEHSYQQPTIDLLSLGDSFIWCTAIDPAGTWTADLSTSYPRLGSP